MIWGQAPSVPPGISQGLGADPASQARDRLFHGSESTLHTAPSAPSPTSKRPFWSSNIRRMRTSWQFAAPDAMALLALETQGHPLHLGMVQVFQPPAGAGPDFARRRIYEEMRASTDVAPRFRGHPTHTRRKTSALRWSHDEIVDIDYHFRRTVLPGSAGDDGEFLALISDLHSRRLDRRKPLWEVHMIEGLKDGQFAFYSKIHHALIDGLSGLKVLQGSLTTDPADDRVQPWWSASERTAPTRSPVAASPTESPKRSRTQRQRLARRVPRTVFNLPSGGMRRCATLSWPLSRVRAVSAAAGVTINDVVLAIVSGALRAYLAERNALPDIALGALVPISLRTQADGNVGNVAGAGLCNLATDLDDPVDRLNAIHASMQHNKGFVRKMPRPLAITVATLLSMPISSIPGLRRVFPPLFNTGVSNIFGGQESLYCNGARLVDNYPLGPTLPGQTLNFVVVTTGDSLNLGVVGCVQSVPDFDRVAGHLTTSFTDLERAMGL